jgi:thiamine-monophosphate kinase
VPDKGNQTDGELALLNHIRARAQRAPGRGVRLGIGDDCALLGLASGEDLAITTDLSIDGRHFQLEWRPPESIGHRALARGLSDLAAMGARPLAAFLSLGAPRELVAASRVRRSASPRGAAGSGRNWIDRFLDGFLALAKAFRTPLAGGDLAESPLVVADIVLAGAVRRGRALLRSAARPGDVLYVTGALGDAARGLERLTDWAAKEGQGWAAGGRIRRLPKNVSELAKRHLYPQPRVAQGLILTRRGVAAAAIDLSDGLSTDLAHLCRESDVAAEVEAAALPVAPGATLEQALHGGEDYELLFTARQDARIPRQIVGVRITPIGRIVRQLRRGPQVTLLGPRGRTPLEAHGWEHFRKGTPETSRHYKVEDSSAS